MKNKVPELPRFRITFSSPEVNKAYVIESQDEPTAYQWGEQQLKYWSKCFSSGKDLGFDENPRKLKLQVLAL